MKKLSLSFLIFCFHILLLNSIFSQTPSINLNEDIPIFLKKQLIPKTFNTDHITKKPGHYSKTDWAAVIDSTWGQGLPVNEKLQIFDTFWNTIDQEFSCFQGIEDNWDSLRTMYRNEILDTVSRGRFAAIMNYLSLDLKESHTYCVDLEVYWNTPFNPGVPLFFYGGWGTNNHFGAGLTPLPDSSLLVYKTVANHPLGLVPGDIVFGYDGIPWKHLYQELLETQIPLAGYWWGSSESSFTHSMLNGAGMNWHLFDTIDIIKYYSGDTLHLPTSNLIGQNMYIHCSDQIDIPGVPMPNYTANQWISYGMVSGTQIGYIYGWAWLDNAETEFYNAVYDLMFNHNTDGLIIDFRMNYGGNMFFSNQGLSLLFDESVTTIGFAIRSDPNNHLAMTPSPTSPPSNYVIPGNPSTFYDKPIAVLTGPGALSSGDQVALRMKFHPMTRFFGKSTSTAFNSPTFINYTNPDWESRYARSDAYLASDPNNYLTHDEFIVDEEVWLTQDDVAQGFDTVVKSAIAWIDSITVSSATIINVPADIASIQGGIDLADDGDTVLVQPGTYYENINFNGKSIVVGSLTLTTGDTSYISQTIIDAGTNSTVVKIENGEDSTAVLCGFTITKGDQGGISIINSQPNISNLYIRNNNGGFGGGIGISDSHSKISNVYILNNFAFMGGGVFCNNSSIILENVTVSQNVAFDRFNAGVGGGIHFVDSDATLINIVITRNNARGMWNLDGYGGGISCNNTFLNLNNVTICNNGTGDGGIGGGFLIGGDSTDIFFDPINRCNIYNNFSDNHIGNLLYSFSDSIIAVIVDTFTVLNPDSTHAYPLNKFTFDILHDASGNPNIVEKSNTIPLEFSLSQNYPNPFNPSTTIEFSIPKSEFVTLKIYNLLGQEVATLVSEKLATGNYKYEWDAGLLASGVYIYKIQAGSFHKVRKMVYLK